MNAGMLAPRFIPEIDWAGVPPTLKGKASAVCRSLADCEDLVHWYGDADFCPFLPVLLLIPGAQPTAIVGDGYATAAELRDCAVVYWETQTNRVASGSVLDFAALRERAGLPEKGKADELTREALWERQKRHKATPVTDPAPQSVYPNPTGKIVFGQMPEVKND